MIKELLIVFVVGLSLFALGYGVGRFTTPAKVVTVTQIQTVEKEVIKWKTRFIKDKSRDVIIVTHKFPDGTLITRRDEHDKERDDTKSIKEEEDTKTGETTERTRTEYRRADWRIGALIGSNIKSLATGIDYGARAERRILGPIWVGAEATTSGRIGVSLALEF